MAPLAAVVGGVVGLSEPSTSFLLALLSGKLVLVPL